MTEEIKTMCNEDFVPMQYLNKDQTIYASSFYDGPTGEKGTYTFQLEQTDRKGSILDSDWRKFETKDFVSFIRESDRLIAQFELFDIQDFKRCINCESLLHTSEYAIRIRSVSHYYKGENLLLLCNECASAIQYQHSEGLDDGKGPSVEIHIALEEYEKYKPE